MEHWDQKVWHELGRWQASAMLVAASIVVAIYVAAMWCMGVF